MATSRVVNTMFWKDSYVVDLQPDEKVLFLYLLTNPLTNIAGIYELSIREIVFDTSIEKKRVEAILSKFVIDKKITYINGWVALHNWTKHQSNNPNVRTGIKRIIDELPEWLRKELLDPDDKQSSLLEDSLSKPINSDVKPIRLNLTRLNLTKLNSTDKPEENSKELSAAQKRQYAIAMNNEREQEKKSTSG